MTEAILSAIDRFGVSAGLLMAFVVAIWRIVGWLAPRVDKVVDSHCEFVATVGMATTKQAEALTELSRVQAGIEHTQELILDEIRSSSGVLKRGRSS